MKKIMTLLLAVFLAVSFTACTLNPLNLFNSDNKGNKKGNKTKIERQKDKQDGKAKNNNKQNKKSNTI